MTDTPTTPTLHLSEDVQDVLHLAQKAAGKASGALLQDRHFLLGLTQLSRLFTRTDALLKKCDAAPKKLKQLYEKYESQSPQSVGASTLMHRAQQIAASDPTGEGANRVEIEHLLLALCHSDDPLVQQITAHTRLKPDTLLGAAAEVKEQSPIRFTLYCIRETLEIVAVVLVLLIVIKQGIGEFRLIPSESMVPTLQIGDRIAVEKVTHWYRPVERGDILVFYPPEPETILKNDPWSLFLRWTGFSGILFDKDSRIDTAYIKRVVGLPGDTVEIRPHHGVYINGEKLSEPYVNETANSCGLIADCRPFKVPPYSYFMMGDNRNQSRDSRYWGFLPQDRVIGRAVFRFFPFDPRFGELKAVPQSER